MKRLLLIVFIAVFAMSCDEKSAYKSLPKGSIIGWGLKSEIPKGWVVCDGSNGTPDLSNRFAYGTQKTSEVGDTIGTENHKHSFSSSTDPMTDDDLAKGVKGGLQKMGDERHTHNHTVKGNTDTQSNIPPGTKIVFIMKI